MTFFGKLLGQISQKKPDRKGAKLAGKPHSAPPAAPFAPTGQKDLAEGPSQAGAAHHPTNNAPGAEHIPKLVHPGSRGRTSPLGRRYGIEKFATFRRSVRQLRRLFDEGELGSDPILAAEWTHNEIDKATHSSTDKRLSDAIKGASDGTMARRLERAQQKKGRLKKIFAPGTKNQSVDSLDNTDEIERPFAELREGEAKLLGHLKVVEIYWYKLNGDFFALHTRLSQMVKSGALPIDIISTPEIKRLVREFSNDMSLLQKDIAAFRFVAEGYSEGLMALRQRTIDSTLYNALVDATQATLEKMTQTSAAKAGSSAEVITQEDAAVYVEDSLLPQIRIVAPKSEQEKEIVSNIKARLIANLPTKLKKNLGTKSKTKSEHLPSDEDLERLAQILADIGTKLDPIRLVHPLQHDRKILVTEVDSVSRLRTHFQNYHEVLTAILNKTLLPMDIQLRDNIARLTDEKMLAASIFVETKSNRKTFDDLDVLNEPTESSDKILLPRKAKAKADISKG